MRSPTDASPTPSRLPAHGWGRCGLLFLHRSGLAPPTPCRSPGALRHPPIADSRVEPSVPSCLSVLPPRPTPAEFVPTAPLPGCCPFRPA
jgi:hypothetical protein